jgi:type IV secretory pathway TrbL component
MAAVFHALRREKVEDALNVLLLPMLAFVAYLRWLLMP